MAKTPSLNRKKSRELDKYMVADLIVQHTKTSEAIALNAARAILSYEKRVRRRRYADWRRSQY